MALILAFATLLGLVFYWRFWVQAKDSPYYPIEPDTTFRVLKLAHPTNKDVIYDLGSGDGRMLIAAALKYGALARGIEINPFRYLYSSFWVKLLRLSSQVKIIKNDIFKVPLHDATIVIIYLIPETNKKLQPKLIRELKPNTKIIAIAFPLEGWQPIKINPHGSIFGMLYLYQIGQSEPKPVKRLR